jgi:hypothetical protein
MRGLVQYIASYSLDYPIGLVAFDIGDDTAFKDTDHNNLPDVIESLMGKTVGPFVSSAGLLSDRSQTMRDASKATIIQAEEDLSEAALLIIAELNKVDGAYSGFFPADSTMTAADLATMVSAYQTEADAAHDALVAGTTYTYGTAPDEVQVNPAAMFSGPAFSLPNLFKYSGGGPDLYFATGTEEFDAIMDEYYWEYTSGPTISTDWTPGAAINRIFLRLNTTEIAKIWPNYTSQVKDPYIGTFSDKNAAGILSTSGNWKTAKWMFGF